MRRKVSLWVVIALVGALAATTAAIVVLAQRDDRGDGSRGGERSAAGLPPSWSEERGEWQGPMMGPVAWERESEAPVLPWVLFAVATGTAVGLLVAWSPWRGQPATVTVGPLENDGGRIAQSGETPAASAGVETKATNAGAETTEALVTDDATSETPPQA